MMKMDSMYRKGSSGIISIIIIIIIIISQVDANENGLLGRSGDRGLNAFANNSSPESAGPVVVNPV